MKILIAGAKGQLARALTELLTEKSMDFLAPPEEEFDVTDFKKVKEMVRRYKPDFVINCSAYNLVDEAEENWKEAFLVNGIGVKNLTLSCMDVGATFVHFSTDYVFDGRKQEPYTIADVPHPINKYGMSKLLGESYILQAGYPKYYLIRVSWLFGDGEASFVMKLLGWMKKNKTLKIVIDQVSSPTYTEDLAGAVLNLIKTGSFGLFQITNSGYCSRYEWAKFIAKNTGWDGEIVPAKSAEFSTAAARPKFSVLDNFPLKETIGYLLPDWKDATKRFLEKMGDTI